MTLPEATPAVGGSEEVLALGGNIELSGFHKLDRDTMIVMKKIVGNYAKRFSEVCAGFQKLKLKMKPVHESEHSGRYELNAMLVDNGKNYTAEYTDRNLFFAVDRVMKKIEAEIAK